MNTKRYYIVTLVLFAASIMFIAAQNQDEVKKITNKDLIKFSHSFHLEMVDCEDCHTVVSESESLSDRLVPDMDACAECHDVEDDDNCETCHYEDVYEPLIQKEANVSFNHKLHISNGAKCFNCHVGLLNVDYVFQSENGYPKMDKCMDCHNTTSVASSTCETCHSETFNLYPESHQVSDFFKRHKFIAGQDDNCATCHDNNFCESCHAATTGLDVANTADDFYTPYSPHKFIDNKKMQNIELVHSLDFRFTHGIEAKGKDKNCTTCHETETFCVECHANSGGDIALGGATPISHSMAGFTVIGVGSGGGIHAEMARRDIETCVGCHDVNGSDPSCIMCHNDPDGIKGTNPKTHALGFMSDSEGDWHDNFGSNCYSCHTDANANPNGIAGVGFCGYCHESK